MGKKNNSFVTEEMLVKYYELNKKKKEIELEMSQLKDIFQDYFNNFVGKNNKAEITINGYKLQRQIREMKKYNEDDTVKRLEELKMDDFVQTIKKPDEVKIKAALDLGLLQEDQLKDCIVTTYSPAISVKSITPR